MAIFGKSIAEARKYFDELYPRSLSPNSKIVQKLLTRFLISADHYELLSNIFLSLVRTLGEAVSGDEKLMHFTGNSEHIIAVKAKPAHVGCLENGLTYELHTMMMRVDKSRNETAVVDEVMRRWKNVIDGFHSPCLLIFDKYYFSRGSLEVLLDAEQSTSTMFIGSTRKSSMAKVCDTLKGEVNKPGQWEGLYHADNNLVLIEYYDFDPNIKKKTVLSNVFVNSKRNLLLPRCQCSTSTKPLLLSAISSTRVSMSAAGRTSKEVT